MACGLDACAPPLGCNQFQGDITSSGLSEATDGESEEGGVSAVEMATDGHTPATAVPALATPCLCGPPHTCLRASVPLVERQRHVNDLLCNARF